jgi:hypothetical protein
MKENYPTVTCKFTCRSQHKFFGQSKQSPFTSYFDPISLVPCERDICADAALSAYVIERLQCHCSFSTKTFLYMIDVIRLQLCKISELCMTVNFQSNAL